MLEILERNYKQSPESVEAEFKDCKYVMKVDDVYDTEGYLLVVSTSFDSEPEFVEYIRKIAGTCITLKGGEYGSWIGGLLCSD